MTRKSDRQNRQPSNGPIECKPESEGPSDYHFDITEYSQENLRGIEELIRNKGRGHSWDFFDPEDLANEAMVELWKTVITDADSFREKVSVDKLLLTIAVRLWGREVRRELGQTNLRGCGFLCVSLFSDLDRQVADLGVEFKVALRELLDYVQAKLSPRQKQIVDELLDERKHSEIALILNVSESTIDREIASIKKNIVSRLGEEHDVRATSNEQRATSNEQRATRWQPCLKKMFSIF